MQDRLRRLERRLVVLQREEEGEEVEEAEACRGADGDEDAQRGGATGILGFLRQVGRGVKSGDGELGEQDPV